MTEQDEAEKNTGLNEAAAADSTASAEETEAAAEGADEEIDLWAEAMAEQEAQEATKSEEPDSTQAEESDDDEDLWAAAMAEQTQGSDTEEKASSTTERGDKPTASSAADTGTPAKSQATPPAEKQPQAEAAGERVFRPLEQSNQGTEPRDLEMILDIPVRLSVELGRTKVTIKQLLEMAQGSVVELEGLAGEPMDILINGYLIAQGEVVVVEDKYGIRITEIVTPSERVQKLNR